MSESQKVLEKILGFLSKLYSITTSYVTWANDFTPLNLNVFIFMFMIGIPVLPAS